MKFLSVCSGIEAASVAWNPLGWKAWAFSEIDKFPSAVLAHHYPDTPNLGDMTAFKDWPDATLDLLCGGTPCQSFSNAGLRKGLDDPRGNLMLTFGAIAARYRPKWLVWENVPGVLSSNGGRDFGTFLGLLGLIGYGFAYRVLDAQFVRVDGYPRAVPQRRQRVFVVGCLGDWRSAAAVLLERESLRGDSAPRRRAGETIAPCIRACAANGGAGHGARSGDSKDELIVPVAYGGNNTRGPISVSSALSALSAHGGPSGRMDFESETFVAHTLRAKHNMAHREDVDTLVAHTLRGEGFDASEDGTGRGTPLVPIAFGGQMSTVQTDENLSQTLQRKNPQAVMTASAVRRLTPRECEALQGFPLDYTLIPWRGGMASDGPRYKALGNSWAVNCARWIGRRIEMVEAIHAERARDAA